MDKIDNKMENFGFPECDNVAFSSYNENTDPEYMKFVDIDISNPNILDRKCNRRRRSPVMVEFADPTITAVDIQRAIHAGLNIAKFRLAFSTKSEKIDMLSKIDKAAHGVGLTEGHVIKNVATCTTLKTWLKKTGVLANDSDFIELEKDAIVKVTNDLSFIDKTNENIVFLDYANLSVDIKSGMDMSVGQGEIMMQCLSTHDDKSIWCKVTKGGKLKNFQTVSIRNFVNTTPFLSKVDIQSLKFCCQYHLDMLIIYYVENDEMIKNIRLLMAKAKFKPLLFSAICTQKSLDNLEDIVKESDGVVFARSFLTFELDLSKVYRITQIQKWVSGVCRKFGKPLFLSGGVFHDVLTTGEVSDPEVSDVTNALMDGVTGFILRDCYDIQNTLFALQGMNEVCCEVEPLTFNKSDFWRILREPQMPVNAAEAAIISAVGVANQTNSRVMVIPTVTGHTVRTLLWLRPSCIVITVCSNPEIARRLCSCRNVMPLVYSGPPQKQYIMTMDARVMYAAKYAVGKAWLKYGDSYISLQRSSQGSIYCDTVRVWTVTFTKKLLIECHYSDEEDKREEIETPKPEKKKKKKKKKKQEVVNEEQEAVEHDTEEIIQENQEHEQN